METQETRQTRTGIESAGIPLMYVYRLMEVDPTVPGAGREIRRKSLKMIPYLRTNPRLLQSVIKAGTEADRYHLVVCA